MPLSQNDMGHALEYKLADVFAKRLNTTLTHGNTINNAQDCYIRCPMNEQIKMTRASMHVVDFLINHDASFQGDRFLIDIQADSMGRTGDVRDILITNIGLDKVVGISSKNRHNAVKHSRLSRTIDFGYRWFGINCTQEYHQAIGPIFDNLDQRTKRKEYWRDIENKIELFYTPLLHAFVDEMKRLLTIRPDEIPARLMKYLLGEHNYYKVIKENGTVSILSFNLDGSLGWGKKLPMPTEIIQVQPKPDNDTTINITFNHGWQLSLRIHNARSLVEPSLKFDIEPIGFPLQLTRHNINYNE